MQNIGPGLARTHAEAAVEVLQSKLAIVKASVVAEELARAIPVTLPAEPAKPYVATIISC